MMTISRGSELSAQPGGLRLSDNSQQNSYSIMFQSNLRVECFMSALLTLCFDSQSQSLVSKVREAHLRILRAVN